MPIVLNGSGTVTGISVGGLPDGIVDGDTLASGVGGKVLQVVSGTDNTQRSASSTNMSHGNSTAIATLTPSATSSKILVQAHFCGSLGDYGGGFKLFRGSTWISQPTSASSRNLVHTGGYIGQNYTVQQYSISILDEPSTTSATTYTIVFNGSEESTTYYLHRGNTSPGQYHYYNSADSSITLQEVVG